MNIGRAVVVCLICLEDLELSDSTLFQNSHADGVEQIDADIIPDRPRCGWLGSHVHLCARDRGRGGELYLTRTLAVVANGRQTLNWLNHHFDFAKNLTILKALGCR